MKLQEKKAANKPYWPRTLQLLPVHLQARDGYVEQQLSTSVGRCMPCAYGIVRIAMDNAAAAQGLLVVQRLEAVFPSGQVAYIEETAPVRRDLTSVLGTRSAPLSVYLALPRPVLRGPNVAERDGVQRSLRFVADASNPAERWLEPNVEIVVEGEPVDRFELLFLGQVQRIGRALRFVPAAAPTVLRLHAATTLSAGLRKLIEAMESRRRELARFRAEHPFNLASVQSEELPRLQLSVLLQRHQPLLAELAARRSTHPRELYDVLCSLHGAFAAFVPPEPAPSYDHDEPGEVFGWLFDRIATLVDRAARDRTVVLPFKRTDTSNYYLSYDRVDLVGKRALLVASCSDEPFLRERLPLLLKMASPTAIAPLLDSAVRGVAVSVEFDPPAAVPRRAGVVAYRIDVRDPLWLDIEDRTQIQLNLVEAPPSLQVFLYGIEQIA